MDRILLMLVAAFGAVALLVGYLAAAEWLLARLSTRAARAIRPWFWVGPAFAFLSVFLVYPMLSTVVTSLLNARGEQFVGLANYAFVFGNDATLSAMRNNLLWLVFFTGGSVLFGLLVAVLADRVSYGGVAKTILFLPMAISNVAAGVIWRFMYDYRPPGLPQTGTVNAALGGLFGSDPIAWLIDPVTNNGALIFVGIWTVTGFCMVILSAGLRGIPEEILEASRVDGATEWQAFVRIMMPLIAPTMVVVATTMVINSLRIFDIVYVMTNGNFNTDVIANQMYKQLFVSRDLGRSSAIAVVLLLAVAPVMVLNVRRYRAQAGGVA